MDYTVYNDADHEVRVYPGWDSETNGPTGPTIVSREDWTNNYDETFTMSATPATNTGRPTGGEVPDELQSLVRTLYNEGGQAIEADAYFSFDGIAYDPDDTKLGELGVNYCATTMAYDDQGRLSRTALLGGTGVPPVRMTRTIRDGQDRVLSEWIGTNDTPEEGDWSPENPADMIRVAAYEYDNGEIGDGLLTSSTDALDRVTTFGYDFRGRQTSQTLPDPDGSGPLDSPVYETEYDNMNRVISTTDPLGNETTYDYSYSPWTHIYIVTTTHPDPDGTGTGHPLTSPVTQVIYDGRGLLFDETDALGNETSYNFDGAGRQIRVVLPDPDGFGTGHPLTSPVTEYEYDSVGNLRFTTDPLGHVTERQYDKANRLTAVILPDPDGEGTLGQPTTEYAYDDAGRLESLTDPVGNVTSWTYDTLGRQTSETNQLSQTRYFAYDAAGRLTQKTDRNERVTQFSYNVFDQKIEERWYDGETLVRTITWNYDDAGQLTEASDPDATYAYDYDNLGRVTAETQEIDGLSSTIEYDSQYNPAGSRTDLQAKLGSTNDFHNTYAYDNLQRLTALTQAGVSGGNAVAQKRIDFAYTATSQFEKISRYADTSASEFVANTFYAYDNIGRLTTLLHTTATSSPLPLAEGWDEGVLAGYKYAFDAGSRITSIDSYLDGLTEYDYDNTSQLIGANHDSSGPPDESYSYDENGNRTMDGYETGDNNQLLVDGALNEYQYDAEGNRTARIPVGTGARTEYQWDHRNRLIAVLDKDDELNVIKSVTFKYDAFDRRLVKSVDSDGTGSAAAVDTVFSWEGDQIALQLDDNGDVSHRYLYGPIVDQLLADETVTSTSSSGSVLWPLADQLQTISDLATHSATTHVTSVANHRTFDSFGKIASETNTAVGCLFAFTGREYDNETDLQYNRGRYYDSQIGRWLSEDPIGFMGGDENMSRYVENRPITYADPSGLIVKGDDADSKRVQEDERLRTENRRRAEEWSDDFLRSGVWLPGPSMLNCGPVKLLGWTPKVSKGPGGTITTAGGIAFETQLERLTKLLAVLQSDLALAQESGMTALAATLEVDIARIEAAIWVLSKMIRR